jgi:predicted PurR-regulated permease PerM
MVLGLSIMGLLPAVWVAERLVIAGLDGLHTLLPLVERGEWAGSLKRYPILAQNITWIESTFHLQDTSREILEKVRRGIPSLVTASLWGIVQGMLIMFIAFFLFRDGRLLMRYTEGLLPLHRGETRHLINRMSDTIHATLFGMIAVALLQGGLGGLMFWWLGLPAPLIWGTIMTLLAVVPYLGTFIVWIPVAFYFALQGQWTSAAILVVWGSIVIGLSDNLLYPFLVGKRLHYHTLVVFFFLLGGIVLFGTAGVVLGPMILALSDGLVQVCRVRLELEGSNQG